MGDYLLIDQSGWLHITSQSNHLCMFLKDFDLGNNFVEYCNSIRVHREKLQSVLFKRFCFKCSRKLLSKIRWFKTHKSSQENL